MTTQAVTTRHVIPEKFKHVNKAELLRREINKFATDQLEFRKLEAATTRILQSKDKRYTDSRAISEHKLKRVNNYYKSVPKGVNLEFYKTEICKQRKAANEDFERK